MLTDYNQIKLHSLTTTLHDIRGLPEAGTPVPAGLSVPDAYPQVGYVRVGLTFYWYGYGYGSGRVKTLRVKDMPVFY